jgi:hypothetical protein
VDLGSLGLRGTVKRLSSLFLLSLVACTQDPSLSLQGVWKEVPGMKRVYVDSLPTGLEDRQKILEIKKGTLTLIQTCLDGGIYLSAWQDSAIEVSETVLSIKSSMNPEKLGCSGQMQSGEWRYWILGDRLFLEGPGSIKIEFQAVQPIEENYESQ